MHYIPKACTIPYHFSVILYMYNGETMSNPDSSQLLLLICTIHQRVMYTLALGVYIIHLGTKIKLANGKRAFEKCTEVKL